MAILHAHGINVSYGKTQRLFEVALPPLHEGDVLGLLGPNAAGKSTLMRTLAGQQKYEGEIRYQGTLQKHIGRMHWHKEAGYMPQTPPQESALMPMELLWSAARALDLEHSNSALSALIYALLTRLGLQEYAMTPLSALSGGKRQLVGLALVLLRSPRLLLLDEPTSALDLHWRMVVLEIVADHVRERGGVAVAAVHDLDLAARYCSHLMLLDQGRVVAAGTVAEVLTEENIASTFKVDARVSVGELGQPLVQMLRPRAS